MNQSEFEANTGNRRRARNNSCELVAIGLGLSQIDRESSASFFNQSEKEHILNLFHLSW